MSKPVQPARPVRYPGERARWLVPSASKPEYPVLVDMDEYDGVGWCACEDFQFRHQPLLERGGHKAAALSGRKDLFRCKHLKAVVKEMARLDQLKVWESRGNPMPKQ